MRPPGKTQPTAKLQKRRRLSRTHLHTCAAPVYPDRPSLWEPGALPHGPPDSCPDLAEVSADSPAYLLEGTETGQGQLTQGAAGSSVPVRTKPAWQRSQWSPSVWCWQSWGGGTGQC